jgi:hypothetical protein
MGDRACEVNVREEDGKAITSVAQEDVFQEISVEGRSAGGLHRSISSQINELIGQASEINRLEVEGRGDSAKKLRKNKGGNRNRNRRVGGSLMDLTSSDASIAISLSETADTAIVASQISPGHQPETSLPSVFTSKTARKHYLQRRKQAIKKKPRHMLAWEFFKVDDE